MVEGWRLIIGDWELEVVDSRAAVGDEGWDCRLGLEDGNMGLGVEG